MSAGRLGVGALIVRFARRLRYPQLFFLMAGIFVLDLIIPDALPFVDEALLALGTLFLGAYRKRGEADEV
ncbi:MAG: hypothetical protein GY937_04035 [bacterium]|nr:hypothetical protein [bacterium]